MIKNSFKDEILLDFEIFIIDKNIDIKNLQSGKKISLNGEIIGLINKVPFYKCDILSKQGILIGKINKIFDLAESVEIEEKIKE
ncbi:hypothetical protein [Hydrogenivirga sp. 128-5-R1-1]|uniref:hypothetical protein n=1 Tax=Hydrogenivirga sp. 128-5-R1-1 TaxID=392423 RepID=UPI00015F0F78|nr:hypothetical protein [Hydrogenivirga sp. 128-5-R1-1]EDP73049.1 hypothetical protein HG1285_12542 [Hydrogenivirga sp. 128-5-R1-1]